VDCYRGIELSAKLQTALLGVEVAILAIFSVVRSSRSTAAASTAARNRRRAERRLPLDQADARLFNRLR